MKKNMLPVLGTIFAGLSIVVISPAAWNNLAFDAQAEGVDMLQGCSDIPEAVELLARINKRSLRIDRQIQEMEKRKEEIKLSEQSLKKTLEDMVELRGVGEGKKRMALDSEKVEQDISRLVTVYDQMKPERSAEILENLPPEFSAEILMRIEPETSAKIMASIEVNKAAILTSFMGARHAR